MKFLNINNKLFYKELDYILKKRSHNSSTKVDKEVHQIIQQVKSHGDKALFKYAKKFDKSLSRNNFFLKLIPVFNYKGSSLDGGGKFLLFRKMRVDRRGAYFQVKIEGISGRVRLHSVTSGATPGQRREGTHAGLW